MILAEFIWNFKNTSIVVFLIVATVFFFILAWRFGNAIEEGVDAFLNPLSGLPDEITVEIVKEKPETQASSQTVPCSPPDTAPEPRLSETSSLPKGKGVYLPE